MTDKDKQELDEIIEMLPEAMAALLEIERIRAEANKRASE